MHEVPSDDEAEGHAERPEEQPERPARVVWLWLRLGPERVRIEPRRAPAVELITDEPPVVQRLQVIPRRRIAVPRRPTGEELRTRVQHGRPRGGNSGRDVEDDRERYEARAAASNASKSGSSEVS